MKDQAVGRPVHVSYENAHDTQPATCSSFLKYVTDVVLQSLWRAALFCLNLYAFIFLLQCDSIYSMYNSEYAIPTQGFSRWAYEAGLALGLTIVLVCDMMWRGGRLLRSGNISSTMCFQSTYLLSSLLSYRRWLLYRRIINSCTPKERRLLWVLRAQEGKPSNWK
jgi:hypothetical protein